MSSLRVTDRMGDLGGYLKEQRENARLSVRQLATAAGVSNPYLSQIERGLRKPSAEVLQQIAKGLQISAEALFMRAGLLEESSGLEVEVAISSDVHLTARQKKVLLDIYSTFRDENARERAPESSEGLQHELKSVEEAVDALAADARGLGGQGSDDQGSGRGEDLVVARKPRATKKAAARKSTAKKAATGSTRSTPKQASAG
ncbi:helix-turn-helix domain-containing protein [Spongisporangium articulatum]|uniref:Helix-turn-helix domain-containing protein n=1 Tax=Spongisporangium articulatum TaxID=3362603 RepID=A0ABW8ALV5_9ACTN